MYDPNTIYSIPINQLVRSHLNCRLVDETHVAMLVDQLNRGANLGPITCRPNYNKFEICCGQHRVEAYKRLGRSNVQSYIKFMSDCDFMADSIRENINRKSMTNVELWNNAKNLYQMGKSTKEIAEIVGASASTVREYICCGYFLSDHIKKIMDKRGIAYLLCKIEKSHQQPVYDRILSQTTITIASSQKIIDDYIKIYPESHQKFSIKNIPIFHQPSQTSIVDNNLKISPESYQKISIKNIHTSHQPPQPTYTKTLTLAPTTQVNIPLQQAIVPQSPSTNTVASHHEFPGVPHNILTINNNVFMLTNDNLRLLSYVIKDIPQLWDLNKFIQIGLPR